MTVRARTEGERRAYFQGYRAGLTACAQVSDRWADQYPVDVFPPEGTSLAAKAAGHGRRVARNIANDIRALAKAVP